jgi:3-methyl-2-oxobutanoate hydroxymethyltransferase
MALSTRDIVSAKAGSRRLVVLTAYDYPVARLASESGADLILVGDSLGMVVLGLPDTTGVTMDDMVRHIGAVRRGAPEAALIGDLPFGSYSSPGAAIENGRRLIEAGADAVKLEGGVEVAAIIRALNAAGIPVVAHIGMLPQHIREEGRYRRKGRTPDESAALLDDAQAVEAAGAFAVVLELIAHDCARSITQAVTIPTIGIGSGPVCDGQVLVTHDLVGFSPWFRPKFAPAYGDVAGEIQKAFTRFGAEVRQGTFPG